MKLIDYARTGIEAGLFTTTRSSSIWIILIFSFDTGTSCLKNKYNCTTIEVGIF